MFLRFYFLMLYLSCTIGLVGQVLNDSFDFGQWMQQLVESGIETDLESEADQWIYLSQHPLNLNTCSKDDLSNFFFLTDKQIEEFFYYRYSNGPLMSIYELNAIAGFNDNSIRLLLPFVEVKPVDRYVKNVAINALIRDQFTFEKSKGYKSTAENPAVYAGSNHRMLSRFSGELGTTKTGLVFEKDAGETLINEKSKLPDHFSGFVEINKWRFCKKIILGDFGLKYGQGLWLSTSYSIGNMSSPLSIRERSKGLFGVASMDENRFLRGAAVEMTVSKCLSVMSFASYKSIDGSLNTDSNAMVTIYRTGYHRTNSELSSQTNANELLAGSVFRLKLNHAIIESGYYHYQLSKPIDIGTQAYQIYRFSGNEINSAFISAGATLGQCTLFGEIASSNKKNIAFVSGLLWNGKDRIQLGIKYQRVPLKFYSPYNSAQSYGSDPAGQEFLQVSALFSLSSKAQWYVQQAYYSNFWLRYGIDAPSNGMETLSRLETGVYQPFTNTWMVRFRTKPSNTLSADPAAFRVSENKQLNLRWSYSLNCSHSLKLRGRIETTCYDESSMDVSWGAMIYQDIIYQIQKPDLLMNLRLCRFKTDDFNSRLYAYEPDVLYAMSIPSFSGDGSRIIAQMRWQVSNSITGWVRYSRTVYFDREQIGSGNDLIDANTKNDFKFQLSYYFNQKQRNLDYQNY